MKFGKVHIMLAEDGAYLIEPREVKKSLGSNAVLISDVVTPDPDAGKAWPGGKPKRKTYGIKRVIFNDPATVVYWLDGTKTVVKCQPGDTYSKETGLALCIAKKFLGNKGNFNDVFNQWIPRETEPVEEDVVTGAVNLKRSGDISVGDKVRVVRYGQTYTSYRDWVELHVINPKDALKWAEEVLPQDNDIGIVKYLASHEYSYDGDIAYVEIANKCYMINVRGLEKVEEV